MQPTNVAAVPPKAPPEPPPKPPSSEAVVVEVGDGGVDWELAVRLLARMRGTSRELDSLLATKALAAYGNAVDVVYLFYGVDKPEHPFALAYRKRGGAPRSEIEDRMRAALAGAPVREGASSTYR